MAAKRESKKSTSKEHSRLPRQSIFLALSLVPLIAGAIFIIAWAMDWDLVGAGENQHYLGLLFILLSFTLSNLAQQKWLLAAGWATLTVADLLLLTQPVLNVQVPALVLAGVGLVLLAIEFYRTFQRNQSSK